MFRRIGIPILIILALISVYLGAYQPLAKTRLYINTQAHLPTYRTFDQLKSRFDQAFNYPSPVGNREISKFANSQFEKMIMDSNQSEVASVSLVEYAEQYLPQDQVVHLLQGANMYKVLYNRFEKEEYLNKAIEYYEKVREIGPNLPHGLYGLYNLYRKSGQTEKMKETGQKILELWPEDSKVKNELKALENE